VVVVGSVWVVSPGLAAAGAAVHRPIPMAAAAAAAISGGAAGPY
jgi:hypothetical protein